LNGQYFAVVADDWLFGLIDDGRVLKTVLHLNRSAIAMISSNGPELGKRTAPDRQPLHRKPRELDGGGNYFSGKRRTVNRHGTAVKPVADSSGRRDQDIMICIQHRAALRHVKRSPDLFVGGAGRTIQFIPRNLF
jgi:hypothetical protein